MPTQGGPGLTNREIEKLVHRYIGVDGGYLGDFSYRTHHEFYLELDLDINPNEQTGTTRERFMRILSTSDSWTQARILEGILAKYPVDSAPLRTQQRHDEIRAWIARLHGAAPVPSPTPTITSDVVGRALADAETLLLNSGASSGVDRVHTALHGYLRAVCDAAGISYPADPTTTQLFKALRSSHPAFAATGPRSQDVTRVLLPFATVLDALNPLRNQASLAHPNPTLLEEPEAMVVVNAARTLLRYVDDCLARHAAQS
jgi:hypothetical protein